VLIAESRWLAVDLDHLASSLPTQIRGVLPVGSLRGVQQLYLTGNGDSLHAAYAAELSFAAFAGVACQVLGAQRFLDYRLEGLERLPAGAAAVIVTSASGNTPRALEVIERARRTGAWTIGITAAPGSRITATADQSIVVQLREQQRSPAVRTYQAALLSLILIAIEIGEARAAIGPDAAASLRQRIVHLSRDLARTTIVLESACRGAADRIADSRSVIVLGGGPNYGTARYAAAKIMEATGVPASAQELDEWWHVERFVDAESAPLVIVNAPGRSEGVASDVISAARRLGRTVIVVEAAKDAPVRDDSMTLPVCGDVTEALSPLLYHPHAAYLAAYLAERLGRTVFQGGSARPLGDNRGWTELPQTR
jgi:glucosamine--fructose-6-phosphate aminotransferase (isomerizing)